ncbi:MULTISPECIES: peroxidase-related enzyme [unclassified Undibacterium]|uniref:carboxymuconolactone decarboxylase family protein n=2 Tax=Undibacterium TaxID=401469 RepID=UPI002AC8A15A|nr:MULTISPECIES: peroxidase-related enzyme [unclassified Undibacterium]MEB0137655.1 peroxidase-related enzyme [Undibacterium sp. CCC2.1]MEB0177395.1 peroxidase-related enzyme [Undibacterium sp. CCC3.4]MEB0215488.1 peroxidase-related enzyme [Undibacterium sp. 5I2]WPX42231.1 peroxidase-related enzyme [Undibacterium sp. CCC3.4]
MTYIAPLNLTDADASTVATLHAVKAQIGMIPNLFATLAKAPSTLNNYLAQTEAIAKGNLTAAEREIVSLATSQANTCHYCLSAHTLLGKNAGLNAQQIHSARAGSGSDARSAAIAAFSQALVAQRGHVDVASMDQFKAAGLSEADLLEIVANVTVMTFSNYANNVARTVIDFPIVDVNLAA